METETRSRQQQPRFQPDQHMQPLAGNRHAVSPVPSLDWAGETSATEMGAKWRKHQEPSTGLQQRD